MHCMKSPVPASGGSHPCTTSSFAAAQSSTGPAGCRSPGMAVDNERIAAIGGKAGSGRRVIDADGLLVTPGWVDVHTHYDGQAT